MVRLQPGPARKEPHHGRKAMQTSRMRRQIVPHGLAPVAEREPRLVRLARAGPPGHGRAGVVGADPPLARLEAHPLVEELVLGEQARGRRVGDDARPDLLEDVLRDGEPEEPPHVRLADAGSRRQLGEGGLASVGDGMC